MDGFRIAQSITKKYAKTFYFASLFLKEEKRKAAYAVYAVCRMNDESVDNPIGAFPEQVLKKLGKDISAAYKGAVLDNPVLTAFRQTIEKYKIPHEYFNDLIAAMYMDLTKNRYQNFSELYDYCYKAAGVVGLTMLQIFGYKDQKARDYAVKLGVAMQLTNILRDIREDFARGRIYLPQDEMARFGVSENDISEGRVDKKIKALFKFQIERARQYYADSKHGIPMLNDANSRFVVLAMSEIYSGILNDIEKRNYDVFSQRAHVNLLGKINTVLKIIWHGQYRLSVAL